MRTEDFHGIVLTHFWSPTWTLSGDIDLFWNDADIKSGRCIFYVFFQRREAKKKTRDSVLKTGRSAYKMTIPTFETNIVVDLRKRMTRLNRYVFTMVKRGNTNCFGIAHDIDRGASLSPGKYFLCANIWCWSIIRSVGKYAYVGQEKTY